MKIHHLNCGTMCPYCQKLLNGYGSYLKPGRLVCHCLLIETDRSLTLVDTGLGIQDVQQPKKRLGKIFTHLSRPKLDLNETAFYQIRALGLNPKDVTDIFPTHMDLDHVGGLSDFPDAKVHVFQPELQHALKPDFKEHLRYKKSQFSHQVKWQTYDSPQDSWFGLESFDCSEKLGFDIQIVPLVGHTHGHVGIAIKNAGQWLLHCGDAYFHRSQITHHNTMPKGLELFEKQVQTDQAKRLASQAKLRKLKRQHPEIEMFCAHDEVEFEQFANA